VRLALQLAETRIVDWATTRVLLVGTGRYAGAALAALRDLGVTDVRVYSPSGRATKFAGSHGITAVKEPAFAVEADRADLILTCTTVEHHVVTAALLRAGAAANTAGAGILDASAGSDSAAPAPRRLIVDLGLPRNVAPDVAEVPGVELLDLETIRIHAPLEELNATSEARLLVGRAARKFSAVAEEQSLAPAVVALRGHVFDLLDAEIERVRAHGDDTEQTERALRHLASVLLHTPMVRSRELARAGEQAAFTGGLDALFGIQVEVPAAGAAQDLEASSGPATTDPFPGAAHRAS